MVRPAPSVQREPIIERLAEQFLQEHRERKGIADATVAYYRRNLGRFLSFCTEIDLRTPTKLTVQRVEQYLAWLLKQTRPDGARISAHTVHKHQRALRMFTKWLRRRGMLPEDVGQDVDMVSFRPDQRIRHLTEEDLGKVLAVPDTKTTSGLRVYLALYILAATGIRQGELLGLRRSDLLDAQHILRIRAETSKSRRERFVPLPEEEHRGKVRLAPELARPLARYLAWRLRIGLGPEDPLFVTNRGKMLTRYSLASALQRVGKTVGAKLSAHVLRHTAAVMLLKSSGGDIKLVYDVLGHSSLEVTKQYLRHTPEEIQARYRKAHHLAGVDVPTREERPVPMREIDAVLRKKGITEEKLAAILFEQELREG